MASSMVRVQFLKPQNITQYRNFLFMRYFTSLENNIQ